MSVSLPLNTSQQYPPQRTARNCVGIGHHINMTSVRKNITPKAPCCEHWGLSTSSTSGPLPPPPLPPAKYGLVGVGVDLRGKTAVSYFPRPLHTSFLMCGAVLRSFSYWGVSYCVAQIELCFLRQFSYFSGTGELNFLMKIFLTSGRLLYA